MDIVTKYCFPSFLHWTLRFSGVESCLCVFQIVYPNGRGYTSQSWWNSTSERNVSILKAKFSPWCSSPCSLCSFVPPLQISWSLVVMFDVPHIVFMLSYKTRHSKHGLFFSNCSGMFIKHVIPWYDRPLSANKLFPMQIAFWGIIQWRWNAVSKQAKV